LTLLLSTALLAGGVLFGVAGAASASPTLPTGAAIDQQQNDENASCSSSSQYGQTFTAGTTGNLTTLELNILGNSNEGATTIDVYDTSAGLPYLVPVGSASFTGSTYADYLNLASPVPVVAGHVYAIVIPASVTVGCDDSNPYAGGSRVDFSTHWISEAGYDLHFDTYVVPLAVPVTEDATLTTSEDTPSTVAVYYTGTADTYSIATPASHGTATVLAAGTAVYYTPATGYTGPDSFTFTANNAAGPSDPATVSVTVTAPTVTLSASTVAIGGQLTVTGSGFPANVSETIVLHSTPATLGTVTTSSTGTFSLTATVPGSVGSGSHTVVTSGSSPVTVTVPLTVTGGSGTTLAATGTNDGWMLWLAGALLLVGALGVGVATRTRRFGATKR
jgi:hypothetical protein